MVAQPRTEKAVSSGHLAYQTQNLQNDKLMHENVFEFSERIRQETFQDDVNQNNMWEKIQNERGVISKGLFFTCSKNLEESLRTIFADFRQSAESVMIEVDT